MTVLYTSNTLTAVPHILVLFSAVNVIIRALFITVALQINLPCPQATVLRRAKAEISSAAVRRFMFVTATYNTKWSITNTTIIYTDTVLGGIHFREYLK